MSALGVGCDTLHIPRLARALLRNGAGFARELFSEDELRAADGDIATLARVFAVKEAALKLLGRGLISGFTPGLLGVSDIHAPSQRVHWRGARALADALHARSWIKGEHACALVQSTHPEAPCVIC